MAKSSFSRSTYRKNSISLQLHLCLEVRLPRGGLVRPSPDGPGDNAGGLDAPQREQRGYAADFLNGPADKR